MMTTIDSTPDNGLELMSLTLPEMDRNALIETAAEYTAVASAQRPNASACVPGQIQGRGRARNITRRTQKDAMEDARELALESADRNAQRHCASGNCSTGNCRFSRDFEMGNPRAVPFRDQNQQILWRGFADFVVFGRCICLVLVSAPPPIPGDDPILVDTDLPPGQTDAGVA